MGRPRKDGTPARKPVKSAETKQTDWAKVKRLVDEAYCDVISESDGDDVSGHKIAVKYGYLCRIIEKLEEEVSV